MILRTRHESVLTNARRSRGTWARRRSSSVPGVRCEPLERGCAELEAPGVLVQLEHAGGEGELVLVTEPPRDRRREPPRELVANVQQHDPWPAKQPLEAARGEKVHARSFHIHGHLSH